MRKIFLLFLLALPAIICTFEGMDFSEKYENRCLYYLPRNHHINFFTFVDPYFE